MRSAPKALDHDRVWYLTRVFSVSGVRPLHYRNPRQSRGVAAINTLLRVLCETEGPKFSMLSMIQRACENMGGGDRFGSVPGSARPLSASEPSRCLWKERWTIKVCPTDRQFENYICEEPPFTQNTITPHSRRASSYFFVCFLFQEATPSSPCDLKRSQRLTLSGIMTPPMEVASLS